MPKNSKRNSGGFKKGQQNDISKDHENSSANPLGYLHLNDRKILIRRSLISHSAVLLLIFNQCRGRSNRCEMNSGGKKVHVNKTKT